MTTDRNTGQVSDDPTTPDSDEDNDATLSGIERAMGGWVGLVDVDAFLEEHYEHRRRVGRPPVVWPDDVQIPDWLKKP